MYICNSAGFACMYNWAEDWTEKLCMYGPG